VLRQRILRIVSLAVALVFAIRLLAATAAWAFDDLPPPLRLVIVGDSTVASYDAASSAHGWGEYIQRRMRPRVQVRNLAKGGATSTSFLAEGRWATALSEKPTVVLIQFGHNELFLKVSIAEYENNLRRFIESARAAGAVPILITPMQFRIFRGDQLFPALGAYADAMKRVAEEAGVVAIDLNDLSGQLFTQLGPERTAQLASTSTDLTHFNRLGAQAMADIIVHQLSGVRSPLTREIVSAPTFASDHGIPQPAKPAIALKRAKAR
jgi:lysophospholipase L1-like esterase